LKGGTLQVFLSFLKGPVLMSDAKEMDIIERLRKMIGIT